MLHSDGMLQFYVFWFLLLLPALEFGSAYGYGVLQVHIDAFHNPLGKDASGKCCTSSPNRHRSTYLGPCPGTCSTFFRVCATRVSEPSPMFADYRGGPSSPACPLGLLVTTPVINNTLDPTKDGVLAMKFPFQTKWPGKFLLIIEAWNDVSGSLFSKGDRHIDDSVARLIMRIERHHRLRQEDDWVRNFVVNKQMRISYMVRLEPTRTDENVMAESVGHSFFPSTDTPGNHGACELPSNQAENSHYTCDDDGELKCLPGWLGDMCDVPLCKKGCDPLQGYCKRPGECRCKLGFYGEKCDKCIALPGCQHGYCKSSFECICDDGWDGLFCSEPICKSDCHSTRGYCEFPGECRCRLGWDGETCGDCQVLPGCQHGSCSKPLECRCHEGWTGILCQTPLCADNCHKERGYCRKPGECRCKVGWWGENCEQCYPYPGCVHGNCTRPWECTCEAGWGGLLCDQELTYCDSHEGICENGATCVSLTEEDGNYRCICPEGFTGRNCEVNKIVTDMMSSSTTETLTSESTSPTTTTTTTSTTTKKNRRG